jgi:hypothetical protein
VDRFKHIRDTRHAQLASSFENVSPTGFIINTLPVCLHKGINLSWTATGLMRTRGPGTYVANGGVQGLGAETGVSGS